jgi:hypothetical protein
MTKAEASRRRIQEALKRPASVCCPFGPTTRPQRPLRRGTMPVAAGRRISLCAGVDPDRYRSCRW